MCQCPSPNSGLGGRVVNLGFGCHTHVHMHQIDNLPRLRAVYVCARTHAIFVLTAIQCARVGSPGRAFPECAAGGGPLELPPNLSPLPCNLPHRRSDDVRCSRTGRKTQAIGLDRSRKSNIYTQYSSKYIDGCPQILLYQTDETVTCSSGGPAGRQEWAPIPNRHIGEKQAEKKKGNRRIQAAPHPSSPSSPC